MSILLAVVTYAWPLIYGSTSIWTFAMLAALSTAFALVCGGRFRTFFIMIAVAPPFIPMLNWYLRMRSAMIYLPTNAFIQFFLYFVAAPVVLVWVVGTLVKRRNKIA